MKETKKIDQKKLIFTIIQIALCLLIAFSVYQIAIWYIDNYNAQKILSKIDTFVEEIKNDDLPSQTYLNIDFESLKEWNDDTRAYIKVHATNIEYPVVQTSDNAYYLYKSFDQSNNQAGWIFNDYRNNLDGEDKNIIVYGHNRLDNSMFGSLSNIWDDQLFHNESSNIITYITENAYYEYEIFSIYEIEAEEYYIRTDFVGDEYSLFLDTIAKRSYYDFQLPLTEEDQILTLSTCTQSDNMRFVIHSKLIKEIENTADN